MSFDWSASRYRAKDLAIVAMVGTIAGFAVGQYSSQKSYDAGYRRAVAATDHSAPRNDFAASSLSAAAMADAAATDAAAAAGEATNMVSASAYEAPRRYSGENFRGMACTDDCSGHDAGYSWAEENGITDPVECGGKSDSFIEGCVAWAEEN